MNNGNSSNEVYEWIMKIVGNKFNSQINIWVSSFQYGKQIFCSETQLSFYELFDLKWTFHLTYTVALINIVKYHEPRESNVDNLENNSIVKKIEKTKDLIVLL